MVTFFMTYSLKVLFLTLKIHSGMAVEDFVNFNEMLKCGLPLQLLVYRSTFSPTQSHIEGEQPGMLQGTVLAQIVCLNIVKLQDTTTLEVSNNQSQLFLDNLMARTSYLVDLTGCLDNLTLI